MTGKNQSFFDNFIWNLRKKNILFLWKKSLFLSITIFLPDFYHLATLSEQNHSFLCKVLTNFFNYNICILCEESIFCRKKWYIYQIKKKKLCLRQDRPNIGINSSASDFSWLDENSQPGNTNLKQNIFMIHKIDLSVLLVTFSVKTPCQFSVKSDNKHYKTT